MNSSEENGRKQKAGGAARRRTAVVACSNALPERCREQIEELTDFLTDCGLEVKVSGRLYGKNGTVFSGTPKERAKELMDCYRDPETEMIFDVSGGDVANGILPYLDFSAIGRSRAVFWGYSDLTTIINGIYAKTGRPSALYQVRNLLAEDGGWQRRAFQDYLAGVSEPLFSFSWKFLRGNFMEGEVSGGNVRCLLKLAGTEFWPDMNGKILLLEAAGGQAPQMAAYLAQLKLMGVFEKVSGILLGTFLAMEESGSAPGIEELVLEYTGDSLPVAKTGQIGHRTDSHGVWVGKRMRMEGRR